MSDLLTETNRKQAGLDLAQVNQFMKPAEKTEKPPIVLLAERVAKLERDLEVVLKRLSRLESPTPAQEFDEVLQGIYRKPTEINRVTIRASIDDHLAANEWDRLMETTSLATIAGAEPGSTIITKHLRNGTVVECSPEESAEIINVLLNQPESLSAAAERAKLASGEVFRFQDERTTKALRGAGVNSSQCLHSRDEITLRCRHCGKSWLDVMMERGPQAHAATPDA